MNPFKLGLVALAIIGHLSGPAGLANASVYPLKQSSSGRYLVDQNNAPCLIMGDSPQALIVNLTEVEAEMFFADRSALGFNSLWINLLCATYTGGRTNGSMLDGTLPFTGKIAGTSSYDLSKTNEAYFAHVDRVLNLAAQHGLQVFLDPIETGSFLSVMADNGTNKCRAYGQFLGSRYRDFDNIIWMSGNDFQDWRNPASDAVVRAVALGIRDTDSRHLHTTELDYVVSSSLDDTNWTPILGLNATYTYYPTYARLQQDYNRPNFLPTFMVEANYEFENLQGPITTAPILRQQEYWTMTSGAAGQLYGNGYTWPFRSGWQAHLDTPGAIQFGYVKALFEPRAWYDLVPDTNHVLVASGYGTFSSSGHVADNDYLTAARTSDGKLAVVYTPILRQFVVDLSKLSAPATTRWYDPSSGCFTPVAGSPLPNTGVRPFAPPGPNRDGDGGWVLVLETQPPPDPPCPPPRPRIVQQNAVTPQSPQIAVAVRYPGAQIAGNANILAVGWNDVTASVATVTDSAGNSYRAALATYRSNGMSQAIYYAAGINGGSNTVTVTFDQAAVYVDLRATEYAGLTRTNAFDSGSSAGGDGALADSGAVTVAGAGELLFGAGMTATTFTAPGVGWSAQTVTVPDGDIVEDQVAATNGSYRATAGLNSGAWLMQMAAFKASPPGTNTVELRIVPTKTNAAVIVWPALTPAYALQQIDALGGTNWEAATNAVQVVGGESQVLLSAPAGNQFYRLIQQ